MNKLLGFIAVAVLGSIIGSVIGPVGFSLPIFLLCWYIK